MMRLFRHKRSDCFLVVTGFIAFVCLGIAIYHKASARMYLEDCEKAHYDNEIALSLFSENDPICLDKLLKDVPGNIFLFDWPVLVRESKGVRSSIIILAQPEPLKFFVSEGARRELSSRGEPKAILGYRTYKDLQLSSGSITLDSMPCQIVGKMGSKYSDLDNYTILLSIECLSESTRERINQSKEVNLFVGSDLVGAERIRDAIKNNIEMNHLPYEVFSTKRTEYGMDSETEKRMATVYMLLFVYSFICCITSLAFWVYERKREILICYIVRGKRSSLFARYSIQMVRLLVGPWILGIGTLYLGVRVSYGRNVFDVISVLGWISYFALILAGMMFGIVMRIAILIHNTSLSDIARGGEGI